MVGPKESKGVELAWQATLRECRRNWMNFTVMAASIMTNFEV